MIFIERGEIDVLDGAFVVIDKNGVRTHISGQSFFRTCTCH